jgi:hypothetical protein
MATFALMMWAAVSAGGLVQAVRSGSDSVALWLVSLVGALSFLIPASL